MTNFFLVFLGFILGTIGTIAMVAFLNPPSPFMTIPKSCIIIDAVGSWNVYCPDHDN